VIPSTGAWTQFDVTDVDGKVHIAARKGDLTINDRAGVTLLAQGQETTRDESQPQQAPEEKKKRRKAGGAVPVASGSILDSPVAIGIGAAAIAGVTTWVLIENDEPVSPIR
jgi:hypothetical protein